MTAPVFKTISEQKVEYYLSLKRPLSDEESEDLHRALNANYKLALKREKARRAALRISRQDVQLADRIEREWRA